MKMRGGEVSFCAEWRVWSFFRSAFVVTSLQMLNVICYFSIAFTFHGQEMQFRVCQHSYVCVCVYVY